MRARSLMKPAGVFAALCASALAAGCVGPEDVASKVHDLRVLAIQAEPPEYVLSDMATLAVYSKVLLRQELTEAEIQAVQAELPTFRLRALVVDPAGGGREVRFRFTTCYATEDFRCDGAKTELVLGEGVVQDEEAAADFPLDFGRLARSIGNDALKGLGGMPVMVTLKVWAGEDQVFGTKRLVVTPPLKSLKLEGLQELQQGDPRDPATLLKIVAELQKLRLPDKKANQNPPEPALFLGQEPVVKGTAPQVKANPEPELKPDEPGTEEEYVVPTFDGGVRSLKEVWRYSWFTTLGYFSPERTGGIDQSTLEERPKESKLRLLPDDPAGEFRVWVVVRDGRGGESWTERRLTFVPGQ